MTATSDHLWQACTQAFDRGALEQARLAAQQLVAHAPGHADAWLLLGVIAARQNDTTQSVVHLQRAVALAPQSEHAAAALIEVLLHRREHGAALAASDAARTRVPGSLRLLYLHAAAAIGAGAPELAEAAYREILTRAPQEADATNNLGTLVHRQHKVREAIELYRRALALRPDHPDALTNLAAALISVQDYEPALPLLRRALSLAPGNGATLANLGLTEIELLDVETGRAHLAAAAAHRTNAGAVYKAALAIPPMFATREDIDAFRTRFNAEVRRLREHAPALADPVAEYGRTPFYLAYHDRDDRDLMTELADLFSAASPSLRFRAPHCDTWQAPRDRPIRLGVISSFLHDHTIGRLFSDAIAMLPRDRFDVQIFAPDMRDDAITRKLEASGVSRAPVPADLGAARQRIAERKLDAIFFPEIGMEPFTYFLAYARLAPVQVTTWGHPVTSGLSSIDGFISHAACEPARAAAHYREALLLMSADTSCTYYARPLLTRPPRTRAELGLPRGTLYVIAQTLYKMHPDFYDAIADILRSDSSARLVFVGVRYAAWQRFVTAQLARRGVAEQAIFIGPVPREHFLNLLAMTDVFLDTFHFGGGNTAAEAIAMEVPVVTLPGRFLRGRLALGWLRKLGMDSGVARDTADYVDIATTLGRDRDAREHQRELMRTNAPAVFEDTAAARSFADVLERFVVHAHPGP